jgi:hypothetical protein
MRLLTEAELRLCRELETVVSGILPMAQLNPQTRAMAKRMMSKGILHRRRRRYAKLTDRGRAAYLEQAKTVVVGTGFRPIVPSGKMQPSLVTPGCPLDVT